MKYLLLGYNQNEFDALLQEHPKQVALSKIAKQMYRSADKSRLMAFGSSAYTDGQILDMMYDCKFQAAEIDEQTYYAIKSYIYEQFVVDIGLCLALPQSKFLPASVNNAYNHLAKKICDNDFESE